MEDWQERVCDEQNELRKRIFRLNAFCAGSEYMVLRPEDQELLAEQVNAMNLYFHALQERINRF